MGTKGIDYVGIVFPYTLLTTSKSRCTGQCLGEFSGLYGGLGGCRIG